MIKKILIFIIRIYQRTLSPDHGWFAPLYPYGYCRHFPSCSEYAVSAIKKYNIVKGLFLSVKRILRCNPYTKPSADILT